MNSHCRKFLRSLTTCRTAWIVALLLAQLGLVSTFAWSAPVPDESMAWRQESLADQAWFADPGHQLTLADIRSPELQAQFQPLDKKRLLEGIGETFWLRVTIATPPTPGDHYWLMVRTNPQDELTVYLPTADGGYTERLSGVLATFDAGRDVDIGNPVFRLPALAPTQTIYLQVHGATSRLPLLSLANDAGLQSYLLERSAVYWGLLGVLMAALIHNACLGLVLRDMDYAVYVVFLTCAIFETANSIGADFRALWPDSPHIARYASDITTYLWSISGGFFIYRLLTPRHKFPRFACTLAVYFALQTSALLLLIFGANEVYSLVRTTLGILSCVLVMVIIIYRLRDGYKPARYMLIGFSGLLTCVTAYLLSYEGLFPASDLVFYALPTGQAIEALMFSLALTAHVEALKHERDTALLDPLTGLLTRRILEDRFQHDCAVATRNDARVAFFLIDLDKFKPINDQQGHDAGDAVLKAVGQRLHDCVRESDTVSRFGGDEFAVILSPPFADDSPKMIAERVLKAIVQPVVYKDKSLQVSASIGIAYWPEHGRDFSAVYKAADLALYQSKHAGRATVNFAPPVALLKPVPTADSEEVSSKLVQP